MRNRTVLLALLILQTAAWLPAMGRKEAAGTAVRVTGRVRLVHHWPSPEMVISGDGDEWYVSEAETHKLEDFQQRIVTVEGTETVLSLTFANGRPAGERRTLANIRVVAADPPRDAAER